jgi:hypothetical protein
VHKESIDRAVAARDSPAVLGFFDALVELLTGGGQRKQ